MDRKLTSWLAVLLALAIPVSLATADDAKSPANDVKSTAVEVAEFTKLTFNRDIRPILAEKCFACHGMDKATRDGELRLDVREEAVDAGAIDPGSPEDSELIHRINLDASDKDLMPPTASHKKLSDEEKEILARWIQQGAEYQLHWAFVPPQRPQLPPVKNEAWVRNPIDRFVLARLEAEGLQPAPESDRQLLARRAAFDVTGLPPNPELVREFVADQSPAAYEKYLDKLFELKTWGEHRGRHWLDYARYADTHGIHYDNYREVWAYRDWVIKAFNRNQRFDEFSIEQLAGDLLEEPSLDQLIATGFNRCNMTTNEGGIIDEEYKVLYARDRTDTTATVWMGLTAGCAVCHDHKFDPISMKEFYSLSAFFNNTTQPVRDGNIPKTPPIIEVVLEQDRQRWSELALAITATQAESETMQQVTDQRLNEISVAAKSALVQLPQASNLVFHAKLDEGQGDTVEVHVDGESKQVAMVRSETVKAKQVDKKEEEPVKFEEGKEPQANKVSLKWEPGITSQRALQCLADSRLAIDEAGDFKLQDPFTVATWVYHSGKIQSGAIIARMDEEDAHRGWDLWLEGGSLSAHFVHQWPDAAIKIVSENKLPVNRWSHIAVVNDGTGKSAGIRLYVDGVEQKKRKLPQDSLGDQSIQVKFPFLIGGRAKSNPITDTRINDVRIYNAALNEKELQQIFAASVAMQAASMTPEELKRDSATAKELVSRWLKLHNVPFQQVTQKLAQLEKDRESIRARGTIAHVMKETAKPAIAYVLDRGEYDLRGEEVVADVPVALTPLGDRPRNRLGLAQWLFSEQHPLTARVTVNRFWQEVFGSGIVRTSADFGIMGELPSHPELLDYLAIEFRDGDWDVKQLFKLMLTSATYRQDVRHSPEALALDPENRLLSHGPRYRMDAEMVRDMALWSSGLLVEKIGGPSVRPYQPEGVWEAVAMPGSNTREYKPDSGESLYRRSMYTFWKRAAPPASMEILGAPNREVCTILRERSNTPLQALVVLNDPQFVEAARLFATRILAENKNNNETENEDVVRLQAMAERLLTRSLTEQEIVILKSGLAELRKHYAANPDAAKVLLAVGQSPLSDVVKLDELAAWTMVASQFFNLDEALCK